MVTGAEQPQRTSGHQVMTWYVGDTANKPDVADLAVAVADRVMRLAR